MPQARFFFKCLILVPANDNPITIKDMPLTDEHHYMTMSFSNISQHGLLNLNPIR